MNEGEKELKRRKKKAEEAEDKKGGETEKKMAVMQHTRSQLLTYK